MEDEVDEVVEGKLHCRTGLWWYEILRELGGRG